MTQEHKFISLDYIINNIKKHPLMKDLDPEIILEQSMEVMKLVGLDGLTVVDSCVKELKTKGVKAPFNSEGIKDIYYTSKRELEYDLGPEGTYDLFKLNGFTRMISNSDKLGYLNRKDIDSMNDIPSYLLNGNVIVTNKKGGHLLIVYNKFMEDENNIPLVPDIASLLLAIENYVKRNYFSVLMDIGKLPNMNSYNKADTDYLWYIGQTQSYLAGFKTDGETESFLAYFRSMYKDNSTYSERDMFNNAIQLAKPL